MSFTDDEGFEPIAPGTEPVDADELLLLEDEPDDASSSLSVDVEEPPPLGRSIAFDFGARALQPADTGGPLMTTGVATLMGWLEKGVNTRRGQSIAVDPDFGMDVMPEDVLDGGPLDPAAAATYAAAFERMARQHPRITEVVDVVVNYPQDDDATGFYVSARIVSDDDDLADLAFNNLLVPLGS